ncbi:MAG: hypothetical protein NW224_05055 [Leptolyngbyaceae cyanobacterium bins.302]|nr:hypothetical protein [Leptolyngbyaceae cyanobacterium bins.302]
MARKDHSEVYASLTFSLSDQNFSIAIQRRNAFAAVLAVIGTPAPQPKPRGKSPGWTPGQTRSRRTRYPTVKKRFRKPKAGAKKSA